MLHGFSLLFGTSKASAVLFYLVLVSVFICNALEEDLLLPASFQICFKK